MEKADTDRLRELLVDGFSPDRLPEERQIQTFRSVLEQIERIVAEGRAEWKDCQQTDESGDVNLRANLLLSFLHHLTWVCDVFADVGNLHYSALGSRQMDFQLLSREQAVDILAEIASVDLPLSVSVSEDICFADGQGDCKWVDLGKIVFRQGAGKLQMAIRFGAYEWQTPDKQELDGYIEEAISFSNDRQKKEILDKVKEAFYQGFKDIVRRLSLLLPTFDPDAVCRMPLQRPTTIVPDTSAVHQGALDFVARFLSPMARIKVPDVVYMEIQNQMDNYMSGIRWNMQNRKKYQVHTGALRKHLLSQGGQRTLLRLELHSEVEMDRGGPGADPIRGIIHGPGSDPEDKALGLTGVVRSFADRLIVETAHLHRSRVRPDHPLILLTSDQGMARMAMAEGLDVFFFQSRNTSDPTGKVLTGTNFHPFKSEFYTVPLTTILWELAVSFGGAKITNSEQASCLELWALGGPEKLTWHPLHAKDDLIWGRHQEASSEQKQIVPKIELRRATKTGFAPKGYRFTASKMLGLIGNLADRDNLTYDEIRESLSVILRTSQRYVGFLKSGQLVTEVDDRIEATDNLRKLWQAIKELDISSIHELLTGVPSYSDFCSSVHEARRLDMDSKEMPISKKNLPEYIAMGEIAEAILSISDEGIVATDNDPDVNSFASSALDCYDVISRGVDEWVLTGAWLECLASRSAIHPIRARALLKESRERGVLNFYLEGSTPDTRYQKHTMTELKLVQGKPVLQKVFLYQGDFISPGTAGVRIKIKVGKNNAT